MQMAYARGADRIWIVNVGDLKPLEIPINHFFDMAYDAERLGRRQHGRLGCGVGRPRVHTWPGG